MQIDQAFVKSVRAMEKRTERFSAYVIVNPTDPKETGRVIISYPRDGIGRLYAVAWLPGDGDCLRHHRSASGYGYDKASAAMSGAEFVNLKTGHQERLLDNGYDWTTQLREAGWIVVQAV